MNVLPEFNKEPPFEDQFDFVTFYVNPLHMVFERDLDSEQSRNGWGPGSYECYPDFDVRWSLLEAEDEQTCIYDYDEANSEKKQIMTGYFGYLFSFRTDEDPLYILTVTFIYSVYIAVDPTLRRHFYTRYSGQVPAITQWLLDHIRLGSLSNYKFLFQIQLNPLYQVMCRNTPVPAGLRIEKWVNQNNQNDCNEFEIMCAWFRLLDEHVSDTDFWFTHFVRLKTTPVYSEKPLSVTSFAKGYSESSNSVEKSPLKDKYMLVNQALDLRTLESDVVAQGLKSYPEPDQLSDYPKSLNDWEYGENDKKMVNELIDFIKRCGPDDWEAEF